MGGAETAVEVVTDVLVSTGVFSGTAPLVVGTSTVDGLTGPTVDGLTGLESVAADVVATVGMAIVATVT